MPNRTKKEHKCSHHTDGSHWQNFHFSGKLIVCSVIFGFMLILIGGIVYAIGMDRDDDTKSDDYEDLQKKPPMAIVGPVMMGIGGFIVFVGIGMCLVETNVCRKRTVESSPLIDEETGPKEPEGTDIENDSNAIPSNSRKHRNGNRKKSPSPRRTKLHTRKTHFSKDQTSESTSPKPTSSAPISVGGNVSKTNLSASDRFLTPPSSFAGDMQNQSRDAENQTSASLMKSFTTSGNSWTTSTEFQTPNASSLENSMILESRKLREGEQGMLDVNAAIINSHEFLTPKNSEVMSSEMKDCIEIHTDSDDSISNELEHECLETNYKVDTQHNKNEDNEGGVSDVLITVNMKEVTGETKSVDVECNNLSDLTAKEIGSLSRKESEGIIKSAVAETTLMTSHVVNDSEINTKHSEEKLFDKSLKIKTENNSKDQDVLKREPYEKCEHVNADIQCVNADNGDINKIELKEPTHIESTLKESDSPTEIVDVSTIQEIKDDFQENDLKREGIDLVQEVMDSESMNDTNEDLRKSLSNNDET